MTVDALAVVQVLFGSIWSLFTSWTIPGTNATPVSMALFIVVAVFSIKVIKWIFGNASGGGKE